MPHERCQFLRYEEFIGILVYDLKAITSMFKVQMSHLTRWPAGLAPLGACRNGAPNRVSASVTKCRCSGRERATCSDYVIDHYHETLHRMECEHLRTNSAESATLAGLRRIIESTELAT